MMLTLSVFVNLVFEDVVLDFLNRIGFKICFFKIIVAFFIVCDIFLLCVERVLPLFILYFGKSKDTTKIFRYFCFPAMGTANVPSLFECVSFCLINLILFSLVYPNFMAIPRLHIPI